MKVNGVFRSPMGMNFAQIGKMLQEASPDKDGVGLRVVLSGEEENIFESNFGMAIGKAMSELVADAVKESGRDPKGFKFVYSDYVFETSANAQH